VVAAGNYLQEVAAGTNADKIPATAISGAVGYYPNILVNGGMELNFRWGLSGIAASTVYTPHADRWGGLITGAATLGMQTVAAVDSGSQYGTLLSYTHAASQAGLYYQSVENFAEFRGKTIYLTARVAANSTGMYMYIQDSAATSATVRAVSGGAVNTLATSLAVNAGTTFLYVKFAFDATCSATIDNVMLAYAPVPIDYVQRPNAEEVLLTRRYYQKVKNSTRWHTQVASEPRDVPLVFQSMPAAPTASVAAGTRTNVTSMSVLSLDTESARAEYTGTALNADTSSVLDVITLEYNVP
jgi:hypothetical protein